MTGDSGKRGRHAVLGAVRRALGVQGNEPGRHGMVRVRLERSPDGLIPARGRQRLAADLKAQLAERLGLQGAVVQALASADELPRAIAQQLAAFNLPPRLRHGGDALIAGLDWTDTLVECDHGPAEPHDTAGLSRAIAAAAESGTLFLTSGSDNPSTLNFLPETHFVILRAEDLVGSYEEAWNRLRSIYGRREMPRTVNLVSGPSATADIEQTIVRGAHGPQRLAVFLIG